MNTDQKVLMARELEIGLIQEGMICNIIRVPVRNYEHVHIEIVSYSGIVLVEVVDLGGTSFNVRFFEDLTCHETLCYLSEHLDHLKSKFGCEIGFLMETKNCYRVWIDED